MSSNLSNSLPLIFPKAIPESEWLSKVQSFFIEENKEYYMVETSQEDMSKIEELLEVPQGFFSVPFVIKTKMEFCPYCNRRNNFLDVVATGLKVHTPEFLVKVFNGDYGHIINEAPHQRCFCYECGKVLPNIATKFSAPKKKNDQSKVPPYSYKNGGYTFYVKGG